MCKIIPVLEKRRMLLGRRHDSGMVNGVWTRLEKQRELKVCTAASQGHGDTNVGTQLSSQ